VPELDHRLRLRESAVELLIQTVDFTIHLLFELCDGLGDKANLVLNGCDREIEVTASLGRHSLRGLVEVPARLRVCGIEQPLQLVIVHELILHKRRADIPLLTVGVRQSYKVRTIGETRMNRTIVAGLVVLCALTLNCRSAARHRPTPLARISVDIRSGIVFVPTTIDGKGPFWFELDSGFQNCAVDRAVASRLGLRIGETQHREAPGGVIERATISGARLRVGGHEIPDAAISALDLSPFGMFFGRRPDGILGYDFFRTYVVEIDYEKNVLTLFDAASYRHPGHAASVAIDTTLRQPYVTATVVGRDGQRATGRFEIDTGSMDALNINTPFAMANGMRLSGPGIFSARGRSIGGETEAVLMRVESLDIDGLTLQAPVASVVRDDVDRAGQISGETLRRFTATFDYSRGVLHLVKNSRFNSPFDFDMAGWFIVASGPNLDGRQVFVVIESSPAAAAGVKEGDILLRVDARDAKSYSLDELRALFRRPARKHSIEIQRGGATLIVNITTKRLL